MVPVTVVWLIPIDGKLVVGVVLKVENGEKGVETGCDGV